MCPIILCVLSCCSAYLLHTHTQICKHTHTLYRWVWACIHGHSCTMDTNRYPFREGHICVDSRSCPACSNIRILKNYALVEGLWVGKETYLLNSSDLILQNMKETIWTLPPISVRFIFFILFKYRLITITSTSKPCPSNLWKCRTKERSDILDVSQID